MKAVCPLILEPFFLHLTPAFQPAFGSVRFLGRKLGKRLDPQDPLLFCQRQFRPSFLQVLARRSEFSPTFLKMRSNDPLFVNLLSFHNFRQQQHQQHQQQHHQQQQQQQQHQQQQQQQHWMQAEPITNLRQRKPCNCTKSQCLKLLDGSISRFRLINNID